MKRNLRSPYQDFRQGWKFRARAQKITQRRKPKMPPYSGLSGESLGFIVVMSRNILGLQLAGRVRPCDV